MARLHSDHSQRGVDLPSGIAKAAGLPCAVYRDADGQQPANLAAYDPDTPDTPGAAITDRVVGPAGAVDGTRLVVDVWSLRPAFWDLDDQPVLWISANRGPLVPIFPDAQPQLVDHDGRLAALEPGGEAEAATAAALASEVQARTAAVSAVQAAAAEDATAKAADAQAAATAASVPRAPGKNLFDYAAAYGPGKFWNGAASSPIDLTGWYASRPIPVTPGQQYSLTNVRSCAWFDANMQVTGFFINNPTEAPINGAVAPPQAAYLGINVASAKLTTAQVEAGASATSFEPYGYVIAKQLVNGQLIGDVATTVTALQRMPGVSVFRSGNTLLLRAPFDSTRDLLIPMSLAGGEEVQFQFSNSALAFVCLIPVSQPDSLAWPTFLAGTGIHGSGDDNCPINTGWSYIGGNHGYTSASTVTAAGHGKTTADLGSTWSDGTRTYTLLAVPSSSTLLFGHPYTVASSVVTGGAVAPAATLTHVAGASNTASVSIAGGVSNATQIHPSSHSRTITVELDGKAVPDGKSAGQLLTVTETYTIASYKGMVDWAQANIGSPVLSNLASVPALARVSNTYRISGALTVVAQRVTAVEKFNINMGVTQAFPISQPAGGSRRMMLGGIGTVNGVNLSTLADLTSITTQADIGPAAYLNPLWPATTMTQWAYDSSGVAQYGFAMGILPTGDGHPSQRLKNAPSKTWFFPSSTKKSYPQIAWNRTLLPAESLSGTAYRRYLAPPDTATEITVSDGTDTWVVVERPTAVTDARMQAPTLLGRRLVPAGPTTAAVAERVTGEGITYSVPSGPGWGVWRATAEPARLETIPGATAQVGMYFLAQSGPASTQALTGSHQILYLWPMYLPEATPVDRVCVEVTAVGTGVVRHGVYATDPATGQPVLTAPLVDYGTVDVTATGIKETTIAATLPSGWHWYGQVWQGTNTTAPTLRVTSSPATTGPLNIGTSSAAMSAGRYGYYQSAVTGALGPLALAGTHQLFPPRVAYRRA